MTGRHLFTWVFLAGSALLVACQGDTAVPTVQAELPFLDADGVVIQGHLTFTNAEGIRSAEVTFDTAYQWNDSVNTALRGVDLTVFNENGSTRAHLTSLAGTMDERWQRLTARGNVVLLISGENIRVESEEIHFDPEQGRIWSDSAFVRIQPGRAPVRGTSFTSDMEFNNFRITGEGE
jgi:LPS export ABC transporter protein LptC